VKALPQVQVRGMQELDHEDHRFSSSLNRL
jgi:hypothetical protein